MAINKYISLSNLTNFFNKLQNLFATKDEVNTKSDKTHTHAVADVSGLQSALNGKAASSHGTHVSYSSTVPVMDGTASVGSASAVARSDHRHPIDTSRAAQTSLDSLSEVVAGKANASHTHSIANVTNLQTTLDGKAASSHKHTVANISDLTVTATELNYVDGVTSNVQTQLDGKSPTSHTHSYAGSSSVGGSATSAVKLDTSTAGDTNTPVYFSGGKPIACTSLDLNTSGSSASCTGNSATATKLQTARTIALGTGATGTATSFNGTGNITIPVTDVKESYLSWGGKNLVGSVSPIGAALSAEHSANRLAYLNPAAVKVEYSNDAGSTWTDSGLGNSAKINFVTTSNSIGVGSNSTVTTNHRTRITLTAQNGTTGYVYTKPRKMLINVSTAGHGLIATIEVKTGESNASWKTLGTYELNGWSGWNDIPMSISTFGGSTTQTGNYWYMRLTFATTSINSSYPTTKSSVIGLRLFGDTCWTRTSNMGETGHLYSYDASQNATFPAVVKATSFTENGTALSSKYAAKSHTHSLPNWNQHSSSSVDYIKNRTHWVVEGTKVIVSETTKLSIRKGKTGASNWQPEYDYNKEYIVTVDGVQYRCTPYTLDDGYGTTSFTLGDSRLRETPDNSHPESVPFLVQAYVEDDGGSGATMYHCWIFSYSTTGTHTIEIAELTGENEYYPLNDGFIPNNIPRKIAGIIHQYAGSNAPSGYLLCDGSYYRTDEYPELFDAIGFTYGESGSGVNLMFAVPNLATRVPVGVGNGYSLGSTGGEAKHTLTVSEMPKHDHGAVYTGNATTANKKYAWYTTTGDKIGYQVMETGSGTAHNNMQPYIALNYIISTGK